MDQQSINNRHETFDTAFSLTFVVDENADCKIWMEDEDSPITEIQDWEEEGKISLTLISPDIFHITVNDVDIHAAEQEYEFARVRWGVNDVKVLRPNWDYEQARSFLWSIEDELCNAMETAGAKAILDLIEDFERKEQEEEEYMLQE